MIKNELLKHFSRHPRPMALHLRGAYEASLRDKHVAEQAAIPVEKITAPVLFIGGDDDQMWPSVPMIDTLTARRSAAGHNNDQQLILRSAGHIIRPPITPTTVTWTEALYSGGTPEDNARASTEAWNATLAFIETHTSA